jgi:hypothetical protein
MGATMVIGKQYFLRRAPVLLEAAELTEDSHHAAELTQQAADLITLVEELGASDDPDTSIH